MAIWGSSSSNTASSGEADIKTHLMNQVRQEAAVTNARNLIGVCNLPDRTLDQTKLTKDGFHPACRKSTSTASKPAFPTPAHHSPPPNTRVFRSAWRSTSPSGTQSAVATLRVSRTRGRRTVVVPSTHRLFNLGNPACEHWRIEA